MSETSKQSMTLVDADSSMQSESQGQQPKDTLMSFVPLILIFAVFYFFMIKPQMKKQKDQQSLVKSAKKGDKVVVAGGIIGVIEKEKDEGTIILEIAKNTSIEVLKSSIMNIVNSKGNQNSKKSKNLDLPTKDNKLLPAKPQQKAGVNKKKSSKKA